MKKILFLLAVILVNINLSAQMAPTAQAILDGILAVPELYKCTRVKKESGNMVTYMMNQPNAGENRENVRAQYVQLKSLYDNLFLSIINDLRDPNAVNQLQQNPDVFIGKYNVQISAINTNFEAFQKYVYADTKSAVGVILIPIIEAGLKFVFDLLRNKSIRKESWQNLAVSLFPLAQQSLFMPEFETLWPLSNRNNTERRISGAQLIQPRQEQFFSQPVFDDADGDLKIVAYTMNGKEPVQLETTDNSIRTVKSFAPGAEFRIEGKASGFVYVFAKNLGQFELIYPLDLGTKGTSNKNCEYCWKQNDGHFQIPNGTRAFIIDNEAIPQEEWIVVYSRAKINNFEDFQILLDDMQDTKGTKNLVSSNPTIAADQSTLKMDQITGTQVSKMFKIAIRKQF